jgi:PAS domain S-box-containing protein
MLEMTTKDAVHPDDVETLYGRLAETRTEPVTLSYRMRRKDGGFLRVEAASQQISIAGQPPVRLLVVRDIEHRFEAERRLRESEARYRMLAENSSDMVILARKDGPRQYVSPACLKLLGWTPEEMLAMTAEETIHPEDYPKTWGAQTYSQPEHVTLTYRMRRKDGGYVWIEAASQPVEIKGDVPHRLVVVRDIERRVVAERRLRESEAGYRLLADNSSDMVFQLDRDLVLRYVSPASRDVLGNEPAEMIGLKPAQMAYPDDAERIKAAFAALVTGEADHQSPITRRQHRDGRWIWVESQMRALRDPETGAFQGIVGALRDITQRKAMEDELADANLRLEILATQDGLTRLR